MMTAPEELAEQLQDAAQATETATPDELRSQTCSVCNGRKRDHEGEDHLFEPVVETSVPVLETYPVSAFDIVLSPEQEEALDRITTWLQGPDLEYRLGGYAGTGKTTLIKRLETKLRELRVPYAVCAFTGKAVCVLRKKGVRRAQTLHSLLYDVRRDRVTHKMVMVPKLALYDCDLVIVDEGSMISTELYNDLKKHRKKMLFVGDPAQLEPVGDNPNLMANCDFTLEHIHRQAHKSPILRLAQAVRRGMTRLPLGTWGDLTITNDPSILEGLQYDVGICGRNATRHGFNARRRLDLGFDTEKILNVGETVLCLKNARDFGVFNGMTFLTENIIERRKWGDNQIFDLDLRDDLKVLYDEIPAYTKYFGADYRNQLFDREAIAFDYGYFLTAHKSQGSEWDTVVGVDEPVWKSDVCRWRYTLITRASKRLIFLV